jgi:hypothetical protein
MPRSLSRSNLFRLLVQLCLLSALTAVTPPASASGDSRDADVFSVFCHFSGTLAFYPPLGNDFQFVRNFASAAGPCNGTFTRQSGRSRTLSGEVVRWYVAASGRLSCGGPAPGEANTGVGFMQFGRERLYFNLLGRGVASGTLTLAGFHSGSATGQGSLSSDEDPVEVASKCMNEGLSRVRVSVDIATTPAISG